jgi:hypothetical protein
MSIEDTTGKARLLQGSEKSDSKAARAIGTDFIGFEAGFALK